MELGINSWYLKSWKNHLSEILNNLATIHIPEDDEREPNHNTATVYKHR